MGRVRLGAAPLFGVMAPALFYGLLARFPASSPVDRRLPWLRTALVVAAVAVFVPIAGPLLWTGRVWPMLRPLTPAAIHVLDRVVTGWNSLAFGLGFVSLLLNCRRTVERRMGSIRKSESA